MKKVILSFDYELFFGDKSGTVKNSIINPTNLLLDEMEKIDLRGNFFVDYLMLREYEKLTDPIGKSDLLLLKNQIKDIVRRGHRIEFHIHSHWIDAKYNGDGTWDFSNFAHYSLSSLDENLIEDIFCEGIKYLKDLVKDIEKNYQICAFRAGGWAIQPFSKIKNAFLASGIKIDSSSSYGIYQFLQYSFYDFRNIPNKCIYKFEDDICKENNQGSFIEVPISSFHRNKILSLVDKFYFKYLNGMDYIFSDGTHYRKSEPKPKRKSFLFRLFSNSKFMYAFSVYSKFTIKRMIKNEKNLYCFIDHPKDVSIATVIGIRCLKNKFVSIFYKDLI